MQEHSSIYTDLRLPVPFVTVPARTRFFGSAAGVSLGLVPVPRPAVAVGPYTELRDLSTVTPLIIPAESGFSTFRRLLGGLFPDAD